MPSVVLRLVAIALFGAVLATPALADNGTLRVAEIWELKGLDPATDDGTLEKEKSMLVETLVKALPDFSLAPDLAASWERTGDKTWLFHLRPKVTFHDGSPLTAAAVRASLERAISLNPTVKTYTKIAAMDAKDDLTLQITTTEAYPALPASLAYASTAIVATTSPKGANGTVERPVGTGPFKLDDYQPAAQTFRVVRNDSYWGDKPSIAAIEFRSVPDPTTRSLELQKGAIDFTAEVPYGDLDALINKGFTVSRNVTARDYVLSFGKLKDTPFADVRVRKAISTAINRDEIGRFVLFGMGRAAIGPFEQKMAFASKKLVAPQFDLAMAKKLLVEAGYTPDAGGTMRKEGKPLGFTLYTYPQRPGLVPIAQAIQGQLRKAGIAVEVKISTYDAINASLKPDEARLAALATTLFPDPDFFLRAMYQSSGALNLWGYRNDKVDAALQVALTTTSDADRQAAYDQVQQLAMEDEPAILIAYYGVNVVMKPGVTNYTFNPSAHDYMLDPKMRLGQ